MAEKPGYPYAQQDNYPYSGYPTQAPSHPGQVPPAGFAPKPAFPPQPNATPYDSVYGGPAPNEAEPIVKGFEFSDLTIRRGFIRKVYSILSLQLMVTLGFVLLCTHHGDTRLFVRHNIFLVIASMILMLGTTIAISCCEGVRRTSPTNIIFLAIFTISSSYMVGFSTTAYDPDIVMMAIAFTTVVVVALTVFAMQTKWDFTKLGGTLFVCVWIFVICGLFMSFMPGSNEKIPTLIFSSIGAILFSVYLIHDTQLIVGGGHRFSLSPEEYVLGTIILFLDIINLFLYILRILGAASKN